MPVISSSSFSSSTSQPTTTTAIPNHHRRQYHQHCFQACKSSSCCDGSTWTSLIVSFHSRRRDFGSTSSPPSSDNENHHHDDDDDDEEEWIPPQRPIGKKSTTTSSISSTAVTATTTSTSSSSDTVYSNEYTSVPTGGVSASINNHQQEHAQAQLYTQQRRIDEATDALFVLTPEEEATLTDEELSRRVDEVLALEEELERQAFEMELRQLEQLQNEETKQEKAEEEKEKEEKDNTSAGPVIDWLQTRRAALGESNDNNRIDTASKSSSSSSSGPLIPIEEHTLLTRNEILTLLEFYGGHDIVVIDDDVQHPRMGGADGMIFCSTSPASSSSSDQVNSPMYQYQQTFRVMALTRGLVDHMKERGLDEIGVPGAQLSLGKKSQQPGSQSSRRSGGSAGLGSSLESSSSSWQIVDCRNYIVHIMDPMTRSRFKLEALWTGKDPIWRLDWTDENAVDKYVDEQQHQLEDDIAGSGSPWDDGRLINRLERTSFSTARHRPVIASSIKNRDRRAGRRQRRRLREQQFRSR